MNLAILSRICLFTVAAGAVIATTGFAIGALAANFGYEQLAVDAAFMFSRYGVPLIPFI